MASAWNKWLETSTKHVRALLAHDLSPRVAGSAANRDKARKLLKIIAGVVARGDDAAWQRLALAYDVVSVGDLVPDGEPSADDQVDSTMPAAVFDTFEDSHSVDETVAIGDLKNLDLDSPDDLEAMRPAGSTLMEGHRPASSATVPIPVHMPAGVTASGMPSHTPSQLPSVTPSEMTGGTTPMQRVPDGGLDLEKYAVLCAWTQDPPGRRAQLHAQYGLENEDARRHPDARCQALFSSNLQMRATFDWRLNMHLGFLKRGG